MKELNIYDIKKNIENKRTAEKPKLTPKRLFDFNPNYLSDKNIFEWNFDEAPKENKFIGKANRETINIINVVGDMQSPFEDDKKQKRIFKAEKHNQQ